MTEEGNKEFTAMLRAAFWRVGRSADPFIPALSLMTFMARDELAAAMQARLGQLQGELEEVRFMPHVDPRRRDRRRGRGARARP